MTLLEALTAEAHRGKMGITHAHLVHFAFSENGGNAFISEIETEELVPLLEEWCKNQRIEMGTIQ